MPRSRLIVNLREWDRIDAGHGTRYIRQASPKMSTTYIKLDRMVVHSSPQAVVHLDPRFD